MTSDVSTIPGPQNPEPFGGPPWQAPGMLPLAPPVSEYGCLTEGAAQSLSREELIAAVQRDGARHMLVWTPEDPRVVPACEVGFLQESLRTWETAKLNRQLLRAGLVTAGGLVGVILFSGSELAFLAKVLVMIYGIIPLLHGLIERLSLARRGESGWAGQGARVRFGLWMGSMPTTGLAWACGVLIAMGLLQVMVGMEVSFLGAGLLKENVRRGEFWRLGTAALLHGGFIHFFFNFNALVGLGRVTAVFLGRHVLWGTLLFAALIGNVSSQLFLPHANSLGASGGLMGLVGVLAVFAWRRRRVMPPGFLASIIESIVWIGALGIFAWSMIDNACHVGGLLAGLAVGLVVTPRTTDTVPVRPNLLVRIWGWFSVVIWLGLAALVVLRVVKM